MKDRNVQHASRFRLTKVPGTDDVYDLIPAPGEVYEEGTLINKDALLKDATAALFGLDENAVPDDALEKLSGLYLHYWKRRTHNSYPGLNHSGIIVQTGEWEYLYSSNRNAYPDSGIVDEWEYEYCGIPFDNAITAPKIATGSYTGTDASTVTLHFDFIPKMLIVIGKSNQTSGYASQFASFVNSATTGIALSTSSFSASGDIPDVTWGKTISWTSTRTQQQLNHGYYTYNYIAIG